MTHEWATWRRETDTRALSTAWVSGDYFQTMGVVAEAGRTLAAADPRRPVAVISHRLWMDAFDGKPDTIGRTMSLDRSFYSVVGIAPESFTGTEVRPVDVWLPLEAAATLEGLGDRLRERRVIWLQAIGRLAPGTTVAAASAEAAVIARHLDSREQDRRTTILIGRASRLRHDRPVAVARRAGRPWSRDHCRRSDGHAAAHLRLERGHLAAGARRRPPTGDRAQDGSRGWTRPHAQQFLAEIVVIATITTLVGAAVSVASLRLVAAWLPARAIVPATARPGVPDLRIRRTVRGSGDVHLRTRPPPANVKRGLPSPTSPVASSAWGGRATAARLRTAFVATQVAVSVVLLVGAALLARGVGRSLHIDTGYVTSNLFIVQPDVGGQSAQSARAALPPPARATF